MTVRIAEDCLFGVRFEAMTGSWELDPDFNLAMLSQPVEFEGQVTLQNLVDLIIETPMLRHFVEGFFNISMDDLCGAEPLSIYDLDVAYRFDVPEEDICRLVDELPVSHLEVSRNALIKEDDFTIGYRLHAIKRDPDSLAHEVDPLAFANFCHLPIRIDKSFSIVGGGVALERQRAFTFLELLEAAIGHFVDGRPRWSPNQVAAHDDVEFQVKRWARGQVEKAFEGEVFRVPSVSSEYEFPAVTLLDDVSRADFSAN